MVSWLFHYWNMVSSWGSRTPCLVHRLKSRTELGPPTDSASAAVHIEEYCPSRGLGFVKERRGGEAHLEGMGRQDRRRQSERTGRGILIHF